jgi:MFS family permease
LEQEAGEAKARPRYLPATFNSLAYRDYRFLWFGMVFGAAGQWIEQVALSWLVYEMTGSALMLGLINGVRAVPFILTSPIAGVAADRMDRKRLMVISQLFLAAAAITLSTLIATGMVQLWHLFAFTILTGVAWSFDQPVRQALLPNIVPKKDLLNAISLGSSAMHMMRFIGPAIAGLLIAAFGVSSNFLLQGVAYVGVAMMSQRLNLPPVSANGERESMFQSMAAGLRYVRFNNIVLALMVLNVFAATFYAPYMSLLPVFAKDILGIGPEGLGFLVSAAGLGSMTSALVLASLPNFRRKGLLILCAGMGAGVCLTLFGTSSWLPLSLALLTIAAGFGNLMFSTNNACLLQIVPDELRGRVMAIYMLDRALMPLGTMLAGAIAASLGAPLAQQIMGGTLLVLASASLVKLSHIRKLA